MSAIVFRMKHISLFNVQNIAVGLGRFFFSDLLYIRSAHWDIGEDPEPIRSKGPSTSFHERSRYFPLCVPHPQMGIS